jgi:hypothetical protein
MKGLNPCLEFSFQQRQKVYATHDYQFKELVLQTLTYIRKWRFLYLFSSDYDSNIIEGFKILLKIHFSLKGIENLEKASQTLPEVTWVPELQK